MKSDPLGAFLPGERLRVPGAGSGPLHGLEFAVKDLFDIAGHRPSAGHPDWRAAHPPAGGTAPAIRSLLAAGASLCGVTVMDELAIGFGGESICYGAPRNPKALGRVVGGSSSGSASAVAGGLADFALGTDSGGSVRVPASYCGIYGIRPTHGRIPLQGLLSVSRGVDAIGWFARDAGVLASVGRVLLEWKESAAVPRTLLIAADAFALVETSVTGPLAEAVKRVGAHFGATRGIVLAPEGFDDWGACFRVLQAREAWQALRGWIDEVHPRLSPMVAQRLEWAASLTDDEVSACRARREKIGAYLTGAIGDEVLLLPTACGPAPQRDADPMELCGHRARNLALTCASGLSGMPQVSLPLGEVQGLPLGLSLMAARGADESLLGIARTLAQGENHA